MFEKKGRVTLPHGMASVVATVDVKPDGGFRAEFEMLLANTHRSPAYDLALLTKP